jgi:hypothetical protein
LAAEQAAFCDIRGPIYGDENFESAGLVSLDELHGHGGRWLVDHAG